MFLTYVICSDNSLFWVACFLVHSYQCRCISDALILIQGKQLCHFHFTGTHSPIVATENSISKNIFFISVCISVWPCHYRTVIICNKVTLPYLSGYKTGFLCPSRMTSNNKISPMKFCYNTSFTLPKQSQRSRSILKDGSRSLGLFWKENICLITKEIRYVKIGILSLDASSFSQSNHP